MNNEVTKLKEEQARIFSSIAAILAGISAPVRVKLIHFLSQGPLSVDVLSKKIDQSVANTSMHLRKMLAVKIVLVSTAGNHRLYSLNPAAFSFWEAVQDFIQEIDPSLRFEINDIDWPENLDTTIEMIHSHQVILVDARPNDEITEPLDELHVLNITNSEVGKHLSKLKKKKPILVFCRGRLCGLSALVVNQMREQGLKAYRLNESWYSLKGKL